MFSLYYFLHYLFNIYHTHFVTAKVVGIIIINIIYSIKSQYCFQHGFISDRSIKLYCNKCKFDKLLVRRNV